jgi:hypothetical protein
MRSKATFLAAGAALALSVSACSMFEKKPPAPPPGPPPSGVVSETVATVAATVTKVDLKARKVTVRGDDGKSRTIKVPDEVRNLPQVKVGDQVVVAYYESVAYQVKKPGEGTMGVVVAEDAVRAKAGEKPGAAGAQAVTVTAKIDEIDKKNSTVTLQGPDGDVAVVAVRNASNLDRVAVGDLVEITYTEAVAVSVEPKN